jgi:hypothetical protein
MIALLPYGGTHGTALAGDVKSTARYSTVVSNWHRRMHSLPRKTATALHSECSNYGLKDGIVLGSELGSVVGMVVSVTLCAYERETDGTALGKMMN